MDYYKQQDSRRGCKSIVLKGDMNLTVTTAKNSRKVTKSQALQPSVTPFELHEQSLVQSHSQETCDVMYYIPTSEQVRWWQEHRVRHFPFQNPSNCTTSAHLSLEQWRSVPYEDYIANGSRYCAAYTRLLNIFGNYLITGALVPHPPGVPPSKKVWHDFLTYIHSLYEKVIKFVQEESDEGCQEGDYLAFWIQTKDFSRVNVPQALNRCRNPMAIIGCWMEWLVNRDFAKFQFLIEFWHKQQYPGLAYDAKKPELEMPAPQKPVYYVETDAEAEMDTWEQVEKRHSLVAQQVGDSQAWKKQVVETADRVTMQEGIAKFEQTSKLGIPAFVVKSALSTFSDGAKRIAKGAKGVANIAEYASRSFLDLFGKICDSLDAFGKLMSSDLSWVMPAVKRVIKLLCYTYAIFYGGIKVAVAVGIAVALSEDPIVTTFINKLHEVWKRCTQPTAQLKDEEEGENLIAAFVGSVAGCFKTQTPAEVKKDLLRGSRIHSAFMLVKSAKDLWGWCGDMVKYAWSYVSFMLWGAPVLEPKDQTVYDEIIAWQPKVLDFLSKDNEFLMKEDMSLRYDIQRLKFESDNIRKGLMKTAIPTNALQQFMYCAHAVDKLYVAVVELMRLDQGRAVPLCIRFRGAPGTGKSMLMDLVQKYLFDKHRKPKLNRDWMPSDTYSRKVENEFWDGYTGQFCTVCDDYAASGSTEDRRKSALEVISMVNPATFHLHMAKIEDKACTFFASPLIILTANIDKGGHIDMGLVDPKAFDRRIELDFHITGIKTKKEPKCAKDLISSYKDCITLVGVRGEPTNNKISFQGMIKLIDRYFTRKTYQEGNFRHMIATQLTLKDFEADAEMKRWLQMTEDEKAEFHERFEQGDIDLDEMEYALGIDPFIAHGEAHALVYGIYAGRYGFKDLTDGSIIEFRDPGNVVLPNTADHVGDGGISIWQEHAEPITVGDKIKYFRKQWAFKKYLQKRAGDNTDDQPDRTTNTAYYSKVLADWCHEVWNTSQNKLMGVKKMVADAANSRTGHVVAISSLVLGFCGAVAVASHLFEKSRKMEQMEAFSHGWNAARYGCFINDGRMVYLDEIDENIDDIYEGVINSGEVDDELNEAREGSLADIREVRKQVEEDSREPDAEHRSKRSAADAARTRQRRKGKSHNARRLAKRRRKAASEFTQRIDDLIELVKGNTFQFGSKKFGITATGLFGRVFTTAKHVLDHCEADNFFICIRGGNRYIYTEDQVEIFEDEVNDIAFVEILDKKFPEFKDIRNHIIREDECEMVYNNECTMVTAKGAKTSSNTRQFGPMTYRTKTPEGEVMRIACDDVFSTMVPSVPGDCGSLYISHNPKLGHLIFGSHFAGYEGGHYGTFLTQELVASFKSRAEFEYSSVDGKPTFDPKMIECENVKLKGIAKPEFSVHLPTRSTIVRTPLKFGEPNTLPARLAPVDDRSIIGEAIVRKHVHERNQYDEPKIYRPVAECISKMIPHEYDRGLLTYEESVGGPKDAAEMLNFDPNTAYGWYENTRSRTQKQKGKHGFMEQHDDEWVPKPELIDRMKTVEREIKENGKSETWPHVITDVLKDERLPIDKVFKPASNEFNYQKFIDRELEGEWVGRTRLMGPQPLHYTALERRYFGAFYIQLRRWQKEGGFVDIGIDTNTINFHHKLVQCLAGLRHPKGVAGDIKQMDGSIAMMLFEYAWGIISDWYKGKWTADDYKIARKLFEEIFLRSEHIAGNVLYETMGNPSGCFLTTVMNSLITAIVLGATVYRKHGDLNKVREMLSRVRIYGDDHLLFVDEDEPLITMFEVAEEFKRWGMTYTNIYKDKPLVEFLDPKECIYLGRHFVNVNGFFHGCLPKEDIEEIVRWGSDKLSPRERSEQAVDSAVREAYHYGRKYFDAFQRTCNSALDSLFYDRNVLTFDELHANFLNLQRTPAWAEMEEAVENDVVDDVPEDDRVENTGGIYEQEGLTVTDDTVGVMEPEDDIGAEHQPQSKFSDPYPPTDIKEVLARKYRLASFDWSSTHTLGEGIHDIFLPHDLILAAPNLQDKLNFFYFLRAGVKLEFRANTTEFHSGKLLLAWSPRYIGGHTRTNPFFNINTASCMNHIILSANTQITGSLVIPFVQPYDWIELDALDEEELVGIMGVVKIYVLAPLRTGQMCETVQIPIAVHAQFVNPIVAGPTTHAISFPKRMKAFAKRCRRYKRTEQGLKIDTKAWAEMISKEEADEEAQERAESGNVAKIFKQASHVAYTLSSLPVVGTYAETIGNAADSIGDFFDLLGFSQPASVAETQPMRERMGSSWCQVDGTSTARKLALSNTNDISNDQQIFCHPWDNDDFNNYKKRPGLVALGSFNATATDGTRVLTMPVSPTFTMGPFTFNGHTTTYQLTPVGFLASCHAWWRGGIQFLIQLSTNKFVCCRVRVSWLPDPTASGTINTDYEGDVIAEIKDIKGDSQIKFQIPYLRREPWCKVVDPISAQPPVTTTDFNGQVVMSIVIPVTGCAEMGDATIYYAVWMAGAGNFEVAQPHDLGADWRDPFITIIKEEQKDKEDEQKDRTDTEAWAEMSEKSGAKKNGPKEDKKSTTLIPKKGEDKPKEIRQKEPAKTAKKNPSKPSLKPKPNEDAKKASKPKVEKKAPAAQTKPLGDTIEEESNMMLMFRKDFKPIITASGQFSSGLQMGEHIGRWSVLTHRWRDMVAPAPVSNVVTFDFMDPRHFNVTDRVLRSHLFWRGNWRLRTLDFNSELNSRTNMFRFYNQNDFLQPGTYVDSGQEIFSMYKEQCYDVEAPFYTQKHSQYIEPVVWRNEHLDVPKINMMRFAYDQPVVPGNSRQHYYATGDRFTFGWPINPALIYRYVPGEDEKFE